MLFKLLLVIAVAVQLSSCGVLKESSGRFRNFLLSIPNVQSSKVDKFLDQLETSEGFLELLYSGTNIPKDDMSKIFDINSIMTTEDLVNAQRRLNNKLTCNETERLMVILRKYGPNSKREDWIDATRDVMVHAIPTTLNIPENCISKQTLIDFQNGKINVVQEQEHNEC